MKKIKSIDDLRGMLVGQFEKLSDQVEDKELNVSHAKALANHAGKIIATVAVQLKYADLTKTTPRIPFLGEAASIAEGVAAKKIS